MSEIHDDFYLRLYAGHEADQFEFILLPSGKLQYANNSDYRRNTMINKEVCVSPAVVEEFKRIVLLSGIKSVDDSAWPQVERSMQVRRQELEIKIGNEHLAFTCEEIGSMSEVLKSNDPEGLTLFYYLVQDLKSLVFSLISLHFKVKPIPVL
jgi:protein mago nashi